MGGRGGGAWRLGPGGEREEGMEHMHAFGWIGGWGKGQVRCRAGEEAAHGAKDQELGLVRGRRGGSACPLLPVVA